MFSFDQALTWSLLVFVWGLGLGALSERRVWKRTEARRRMIEQTRRISCCYGASQHRTAAISGKSSPCPIHDGS